LIICFTFLNQLILPEFARGVKPGINRNDVYDIEIHFPPLATQREIVAILDEKMNAIAEAKKLREEAMTDTEKLLLKHCGRF
jgi:type I restriction enzyme S subunit